MRAYITRGDRESPRGKKVKWLYFSLVSKIVKTRSRKCTIVRSTSSEPEKNENSLYSVTNTYSCTRYRYTVVKVKKRDREGKALNYILVILSSDRNWSRSQTIRILEFTRVFVLRTTLVMVFPIKVVLTSHISNAT
jgi:hypothetical protein